MTPEARTSWRRETPSNGRVGEPEARVEVGTDEVRLLKRAFARFDTLALGLASGSVVGVLLFAATAWLVVKGGAVVGPTISLLANYFPGYTATWPGSLVGLLYGFAAGFVGGWSLAFLRNVAVRHFLHRARSQSEREVRRRWLDYV